MTGIRLETLRYYRYRQTLGYNEGPKLLKLGRRVVARSPTGWPGSRPSTRAAVTRVRPRAGRREERRPRGGEPKAEEIKEKAKEDAIAAALLADAIDVPVVPRIVADDVTPEAVGSLLAEQGGRLAIISSEGGIFDIIAGRYNGNVPNLDIWLKGWSGDPTKVDRKGRAAEYIERPVLTIGLMLQPEVLTHIGRMGRFRGRGLLARFLYSEPPSKVGRRKAGADPVPESVATLYHQRMRDLVEGLAGWTDPGVIRLRPETAAAAVELEASVEPALGGDGELGTLPDWGGKYVGTCCGSRLCCTSASGVTTSASDARST